MIRVLRMTKPPELLFRGLCGACVAPKQDNTGFRGGDGGVSLPPDSQQKVGFYTEAGLGRQGGEEW